MRQHICASCDIDSASRICKGCFKTYYCDTECQFADWTRHIFACNPRRQISSADYLALDVREHQFPSHRQVCLDWGIAKATATISTQAGHALFDLYVELIQSIGIKPAWLHTWRTKGTLVDEIKATYERLPPERRVQSPSYGWFLEHYHVLENTAVSSQETNGHIDRTYRRLYVQLGLPATASPESIVDFVKGLSPTMCSCFQLYAFSIEGHYPSPITDLYLKFGFGVCRDVPRDRVSLCRSYEDLAAVTSFGDFYTAYSTGKLFDLFGQKNVAIRLDSTRQKSLKDILESMPHMENLKTVWYLEQSLNEEWDETLGQYTVLPMLGAAGEDYGFKNCGGNKELAAKLAYFYRSFFSYGHADPLKLHKACIDGRLYAFLYDDMRMDISSRDQALLRRLLARRASSAVIARSL
ncbi:hypothetical protein BC629DRAFT_789006 [Irpex lacteus]|nr:hypothetical protein BC629DRAFT_789006 [Irpex lacteus]